MPPTVEELIRLTQDNLRRLVQNGEDLVAILKESLGRMDAKLQGETPAARFLWNKDTDGKWRPKDENELSDYVKLHLDEDLRASGVIVNREVQIRRAIKPGGETTDIQVNALVLGAKGNVLDSVTAIIEVKGCRHTELNVAMHTQLKERYLKDNQCRHGLYLVGWYNCPQWDSDDSRKPPLMTLPEAQNKFDAQARELSQDGVHVSSFVLNTALR